eukprot:SAG22_NODE_1303_length_4797_cov_2976.784376_6_plen_115_part_00
MSVQFADGSMALNVPVSECRMLQYRAGQPVPVHVVLLSVSRSSQLPGSTRQYLASLTWDWRAQRHLTGNASVRDFHRLWQACAAVRDRVKRTVRRGRITRLCRDKLGCPRTCSS